MRPGLKAREGTAFGVDSDGDLLASMRPGLKAREGDNDGTTSDALGPASMRPGLKAREGAASGRIAVTSHMLWLQGLKPGKVSRSRFRGSGPTGPLQ